MVFPKFSGGGPPDAPYKGNTSIKPSKSFFNNNNSQRQKNKTKKKTNKKNKKNKTKKKLKALPH